MKITVHWNCAEFPTELFSKKDAIKEILEKFSEFDANPVSHIEAEDNGKTVYVGLKWNVEFENV